MLLMFMVSVAITACHKQLQWTQEHMQKIKEEHDPFGSWLDGLFGGTGSWLKQLLKALAVGFAIFVCILMSSMLCRMLAGLPSTNDGQDF